MLKDALNSLASDLLLKESVPDLDDRVREVQGLIQRAPVALTRAALGLEVKGAWTEPGGYLMVLSGGSPQKVETRHPVSVGEALSWATPSIWDALSEHGRGGRLFDENGESIFRPEADSLKGGALDNLAATPIKPLLFSDLVVSAEWNPGAQWFFSRALSRYMADKMASLSPHQAEGLVSEALMEMACKLNDPSLQSHRHIFLRWKEALTQGREGVIRILLALDDGGSQELRSTKPKALSKVLIDPEDRDRLADDVSRLLAGEIPSPADHHQTSNPEKELPMKTAPQNKVKMKDSGVEWIGEVPEGWEISKMKSFGGFQTGRNTEGKTEGCIPVYGSSDKSFDFTTRSISDGPAVCIGRKGTIDKPFFVKGPFWAVDTCMYSEVSGESHSIDFVKHWLHIIPWGEVGTKTALPSLTQTDVNNLLIATPPATLQRAIANYLDHHVGLIDEERDLISQKIDLLKEHRSALIFEMVTGKRTLIEAQYLAGVDDWSNIIVSGEMAAVPSPGRDDPFVKSERLVDSGVEWIGEMPEEWKSLPLRSLGKIANGGTPPPDPSMWFGGVAWATPADFQNGDIITTTSRTLSAEGVRRAGPILPVDSIMVSCRAPVGKVCLIGSPTSFNQGCKGILPLPSMAFKYLFYSLQASSEEMERVSSGTTFLEISTSSLGKIAYPVPDLDTQRSIADFLDNETNLIDREIQLLTQKNDLLSEHRKALIFEAVTGKIEINE